MSLATVWRITRAPYADLTGEGAQRYGGRWNPVGVPMVYTSTTVGLAMLETLVHTDSDLLPDDLVLMEIAVAGLSIEEPAATSLPRGWRSETAGAGPQRFGAAWARQARSALLVLPSSVLPPGAPDRNALLNPAHPAAAGAEVRSVTPFVLDGRLLS